MGVWLNVDYTKFSLSVYNLQAYLKKICIYNFYTDGFHNNAKIYNQQQQTI